MPPKSLRLSHEYAAGFFDGEGCCYICTVRQKCSKTGKQVEDHRLIVMIANTKPRALHLMRCTWGGHIRRQIGRGKRRPCYHWTLSNRKAESFLKDLLPYSITKRREIECALAFRRHKKAHHLGILKRFRPLEYLERYSERQWYYKELQRLKREPDDFALPEQNRLNHGPE